jgi:hypothetical protein
MKFIFRKFPLFASEKPVISKVDYRPTGCRREKQKVLVATNLLG